MSDFCLLAASASGHLPGLATALVVLTVLVALEILRRRKSTRKDSCCGATHAPAADTPSASQTPATQTGESKERVRVRALGVTLGLFHTGPVNAITDVPGVKVGHTTLVSGEGALVPGKGPVRTGVTAILPHAGDLWNTRLSAGSFVLNGNGACTGLDWIRESGYLEGPIALTNTHSVGDAYKGLIRWMQARHPDIGTTGDTYLPVVGECDDSPLNDIRGFHVREEHVFAALDGASDGPVQEGAVGAGTGMTSFGFKSGIGTSSRVAVLSDRSYTVGVLVNSNFGTREQLLVAGVPVGSMLSDERRATLYREGSIVIVVATDAPLASRQLDRLARRAAMGLARTGATANHGSGDFVVAFSTTRKAQRSNVSTTVQLTELADESIDPLFQATVEATEEAVLNSLFMASTMVGRDGNVSPALPLDRVRELLGLAKPSMAQHVLGSGQREIPEGAIKILLPELRQPDEYSCGAAALMSVGSMYGAGPDELEDFKEAMGTNPDYGTYYGDVARYAAKIGLESSVRKGMTKEELKQLLLARIPVILSIQAWADDPSVYDDPASNDDGHFVVAIGFDDEDYFYFMDPSLTARHGFLSWEELDKRWHENEGSPENPEPSHHLGIVLKPNGLTPVYPKIAHKIG